MSHLQLPDRRLRLAFFGTPDLAAKVLKTVLDADEDDVVVVVCQPDKPQGRKKKIVPPPVKVLAEARGLEVLQPRKMKDGSLAAALRERNLDLALVAAYGRILTEDTLAATEHGFWNVHASLLPRHRGASPIQHAILGGDEKTGVDLMQMTLGLDEGPVLLELQTRITASTTTPELTDTLAALGGQICVEGIRRAKREGLSITIQDHSKATYAPLIKKADGALDFSASAAALDRRIRALNPWPSTFVRLPDGPLRILDAEPIAGEGTPGRIVETSPQFILQTGEGRLVVRRVQPPGKKAMAAADYLRGAGRNWAVGDALWSPPEDP